MNLRSTPGREVQGKPILVSERGGVNQLSVWLVPNLNFSVVSVANVFAKHVHHGVTEDTEISYQLRALFQSARDKLGHCP